MTISAKVRDQNYRTKFDIRTRERYNQTRSLIREEALPELEENVSSFSVPQPALGVAETLPGCTCQTCNRK